VKAPRTRAVASAIDPGARGFSRTAELYERARPSYPAAAVDAVTAELGLRPGATVIDLGAGTGKWARLLVERGLHVIAVEPVDEMRRVLQRSVPEAVAVLGAAEEIPVAEGSADAVTAAQAFHWFHLGRALLEIHRVLRPGGGLAVVWNERDRSDPLQTAIDELISPHRGSYPSGDLSWRTEIKASGLFGPVRESQFANEQLLDADGLVERVGSISWIGSLSELKRGGVLQRVRELVAGREEPFVFRYVTEVFTCKRR
jgi:SAM-dependent methyltransferase